MKITSFIGDVMEPVRFKSNKNLNTAFIIDQLTWAFKEKSIPAKVYAETAKLGGLFGSTYPCVVIEHPSPPQEYYKQVILIDDCTLHFKYWGFSKANFNRNKKASLKKDFKISSSIRAAFINDDEMAYNKEHEWHSDIASIVMELCI